MKCQLKATSVECTLWFDRTASRNFLRFQAGILKIRTRTSSYHSEFSYAAAAALEVLCVIYFLSFSLLNRTTRAFEFGKIHGIRRRSRGGGRFGGAHLKFANYHRSEYGPPEKRVTRQSSRGRTVERHSERIEIEAEDEKIFKRSFHWMFSIERNFIQKSSNAIFNLSSGPLRSAFELQALNYSARGKETQKKLKNELSLSELFF